MKKIIAIATLVLIGANGFSQAKKEMKEAPVSATAPAALASSRNSTSGSTTRTITEQS